MPYVLFDKLTPAQQDEVRSLRPRWDGNYTDFEFWIKPDGHASRRGGHHRLTEEAYQASISRYYAPVRSKGDNREWKPGVTFHFSNK